MTSPSGTGPFLPRSTTRGVRCASDIYGNSPVEVVLELLANRRDGLADRLRSALSSDEFVSATTAIRRRSEAASWYALSLSNHIIWLAENDFTREDTRQVRYLTEIIYSQEPANVLILALALRAMDGSWPVAYGPRGRAEFLAEWPEYQAMVRSEIWVSIQTGEYERAISFVRDRVQDLSEVMTLKRCAAGYPALISFIEDSIGQSCECLILSCALRRMFIRAETSSRRMA